jgi:integrase
MVPGARPRTDDARSYRCLIEVHILPEFGNRTLASLTPQEIAAWETRIAGSGLSRRTAREARSTLTNILADAVPHHIPFNPAVRKRGKGRKGQRRIERIEKQEKVWATPLQALLIAERSAALSGTDTDFVMMLTIAYTDMRWSEAIGLRPECVKGSEVDIHWKLYELNGRFYRGRPKDGSMRTADLPPFLRELLVGYLKTSEQRRCTCRNVPKPGETIPWCPGADYVFLGPTFSHFRRSNYSKCVMRPAADGWYPGHEGQTPRPRMPAVVDMSSGWPGVPMPPRAPAVAGQPYEPPRGRGIRRLPDDLPAASWLPIIKGLTPHGLRHGHQTWDG